MKTALKAFALGLLSVSLTAQASGVACPAIGDEFEGLLSKLETIKASVRDGANCGNVNLKVKSLEDLIVKDREKVLEIVESGRDRALTEAESEAVRTYAEEVTKKVAALNDLFLGSNHCFKDDQAGNQLAQLGGFVGEAARLVSAVAGPWGTPIALAGNVIAGFMTGMDKVNKSRAGYDFSKVDQWRGYVQNLCTYHSYRDQISHLLNPEQRLNELRALKIKIEDNLRNILNVCDECKSIEKLYVSQKSQGQAALERLADREISAANQRFQRPLGNYMLRSLGLRDWLIKEIARVEKEAASYWSGVSGRHILSRAKDDLESFLVTREAPRFLDYQIGRSRADYSAFQQFARNEGSNLYYAFDRTSPKALSKRMSYWGDPIQAFEILMLNPINWSQVNASHVEDLRYAWKHYRDQSLSRLRTSETTLEVVQGFCSFFREASLYSSSIRHLCTSREVRQLASEQKSMGEKLAAAGVSQPSSIDPLIFDPNVNFEGSHDPLQGIRKAVELMRP